jgi:putative membrane protein
MKYLIFFSVAILIVACNKLPVVPFGLNAAEAKKPHLITTAAIPSDAEFLQQVADASLFEIEIGKLAQIAGTAPEVKSFGAMVVNDYTKIFEGAKMLAASKKINLPSNLGEESWKKINSMADKRGKDFDDTYIEMIITQHQQDIRSFEDKMKDNVINSDLKTWLIQTQPVLAHNLISILEIEEHCALQTSNIILQ